VRFELRVFGRSVLAGEVHRGDQPAAVPVECERDHVPPPLGFRFEAGAGGSAERSYQGEGDIAAREG
jgi:hypothetical protein